MGKSLIITEKPSVAREFANVLHVSGRQNGYIENDSYVITWCVGHLVGMVYPESYDIKYKKWRLEDLPFLPKEYKYDVIKPVSDQYNIVHGMLQREDIDRVYWAGDAGKEGQTIEENIRNFGGVREGMEELRVWIDSQTEEEILRGIKEARPMSDYANLGKSGIMRTIEDYAMGINFSRVMSVKYGNLLNNAAGTKSYTAIAVGRVMTCVLGMVVIREREIRNFKETPFYRVIGSFSNLKIPAEWRVSDQSKYMDSPLLYKENGFKEEKDALEFIENLNGKEARVLSIEKGIQKKKAPLLFNLAELQATCSKRFKISPDETLNVAQSLYEKKLTTYPRTDARVLSTAVAKEISKNVSRLKGYEPTAEFVEEIMSKRLYEKIVKSQYTNDAKVTDHYAIIPTGQLTELKNLNSLERAVFELIVRRFLSIFYPPAEYETVKMTVSVAILDKTECFYSSAKILKSEGFLAVANPPKKKSFEEDNARIMGGASLENPDDSKENEGEGEEELKVDPKALFDLSNQINEGDVIDANGYEIKHGKTNPPKRYTSGSMVLAMENAGQLIEDEELREQIKGSGIGTSATRAEIIQKLVRIGYLNLNKKTQILSPMNLGEMIFEVVSMTVPALLNPKMTASWEKGLDGITNGTVDYAVYREKLEDFIRKETLDMIGKDLRSPIADRISNFASKDGKGEGAKRKIGAKCPKCGGDMVTTPFGYGCSNYKKDKTGCNFNVGQIAGLTIPEAQVLKLLGEEGRTDTIRGFKSKTGKRFDAVLKLVVEGDINTNTENSDQFTTVSSSENPFDEVTEGDLENKMNSSTDNDVTTTNKNREVRIEFDFSLSEPEIIPDIKCPMCGGDIKKTSFGYGCANYNRFEEDSCKFSVGEIAGKKLSLKDVKQLITDHKTDTIRGFKSKAGKKFDAILTLVNEPDEKTPDKANWKIKFDFEGVTAKKIADVSCPLCGGDIVATSFGFGCANYSSGSDDSCKFSIGKMAGKALTEANVKQLLTVGKTDTIRGFKSKAGKKFDGCIALAKDDEGRVTGLKFDFDDVKPQTVKDVKCPVCGSEIAVTPFGFACTKHDRNDENSCNFTVGKIASVKLKEADLKELLIRKKTGVISGFVAKTGMKFDAPLRLNDDGKIEFDFPKQPDPTESSIECPTCGKHLMKAKWNYRCECGFKISHTVAKVELSEEVIRELVTTGKTRNKVSGFTSKAGNSFDTCLIFEDGSVKFDFNNPGEADPNSTYKNLNLDRSGDSKNQLDNTQVIDTEIEESTTDNLTNENSVSEESIKDDLSGNNYAHEAMVEESVSAQVELEADDDFARLAGLSAGFEEADDYISDDLMALAHQ